VRATVGCKAAREDNDETSDSTDDSEHGGDADGLECAITNTEANEVAVRAVAKEAVDMIGDRLQGGRVRRHMEICDGLLTERRRDVELLLRAREQEQVDDGVEFTPANRDSLEKIGGREGLGVKVSCACGRRAL